MFSRRRQADAAPPPPGDLVAEGAPAPARRFVGNARKYRDESHTANLEQLNRRQQSLIGSMLGYAIAVTTLAVGLFPLVRHEVSFVHWGDAADKVVTVSPGKISMSDREAITHDYLWKYVKARETIDNAGEPDRDAFVRVMTDKRWFDHWQSQVTMHNTQGPRAQYAREGKTREIHPLSVTRDPVDPAPGVASYRVFFLAIDRRAGQEVSRVEWVATLALVYRPLRANAPEYKLNPLGIMVANYAIESRNTPTR